jgi:hypothetical protein
MSINREQIIWTVILISVLLAYKFNVGLDSKDLSHVSFLF